jgi:hypothetical protein
MKFLKSIASKIGLGLALALGATAAYAFVPPVAGAVGFEIYDMVVTQILQGAIGMVAAAIALVFGVVQLFRSWVMGVVGIIVATLIFQADAIVQTLGMVL